MRERETESWRVEGWSVTFPVIYLLTTSLLFFFPLSCLEKLHCWRLIPSLLMKLCGVHTTVAKTKIISRIYNLRLVCGSLGDAYTEREFSFLFFKLHMFKNVVKCICKKPQ